jgi:regulator of protease activity HflC (stomatin/prohibitin superfamily)
VRERRCCCCTILIVGLSLFGASFGIVEPHEFGIRYDGISVRVEDKVYDNGRHYPGLGAFFLKYPRIRQYVEFSTSSDGGTRNSPVTVWSSDGQEIVLEAGFYFALQQQNIMELYYKYSDQYLPIIEDVAANSIRDVATRFTTLQFFTNRSTIDDQMETELQARIGACCFADVSVFNLLGIDVPQRFREAVENVVISQQERTTLEILRDAIVLRQSIRVVDANADKTITVARATANADGLVIRSQASADVNVQVETSRASALFNLSAALSFNSSLTAVNSSRLLTFMYADVIKGPHEIVLNVPKAIVTV